MLTQILALAMLPLTNLPTIALADTLPPTTHLITPNGLGENGDGRSPISDQVAFQAMMQAISQSQSSAPTGQFDFAQYQNGAMIEPGIYDAGGLKLSAAVGFASVRLVARIPGTVVIRIPPDHYFLTVSGRVNSVVVDGITFVGGKGAFLFTATGNNVNLPQSFTRNLFFNYTVAAIADNSSDHPYLRVRDNVFFGASNAQTVGVAWGGLLDQGVIEDNIFLQNTYHVTLGPRLGSTMIVRHNDFICWGSPTNRTKADIWLVPNSSDPNGNNSGFGVTITENKFGNENQNPVAPRILIANEASDLVTDRATRRPGTLDRGYVTELVVKQNVFVGAGAITAPVIESRISELRNLEWQGNKFAGSPYGAILRWTNLRTGYFANSNSSVEFTPADVSAGGMPALSFSNATFAQLRDYGGYFPGDPNAVEVWPISDDPALTLLGGGVNGGGSKPYGKASLHNVSNPAGGTLSLVTVPAAGPANGVAMLFGKSTLAEGGMAFLDLTLQQASGNSTVLANVLVRNMIDGTLAFQRTVPLPRRAGALRMPVYLPPSKVPLGWQVLVQLAPGSIGNSFMVGDWFVNSGGARIGRDRAIAALRGGH